MSKEQNKKGATAPNTAKLSRASAAPEGLSEAGQAKPAPVMKRQERIYKSTQEVDHDLFKLEVATMLKNVSFTDVPHVERFEHCHIFHTVDSGGKKQDTSSPVGGHHHEITLTVDPNGVPTLEVSEPRKWVRRKIRGKMKRVAEPIYLGGADEDGDREVDQHTHKVSYLGSERIQLRTPNVEFAKMEGALKAKREPQVEGVREQ